jgi:hypothetical protein
VERGHPSSAFRRTSPATPFAGPEPTRITSGTHCGSLSLAHRTRSLAAGLPPVPAARLLFAQGTLGLRLFTEDLFGPAEGCVCGGEADGGEGQDYGVQDLCLRCPDSEELADVGADGALGFGPDSDAELDQAPLLLA